MQHWEPVLGPLIFIFTTMFAFNAGNAFVTQMELNFPFIPPKPISPDNSIWVFSSYWLSAQFWYFPKCTSQAFY